MGKAKIYGMKRKCIPNKRAAGLPYAATTMRSGKTERAMQLAVIHSYMKQKPIGVFRKETADALLKTAKRMKMSIPFPVVLEQKERQTKIDYIYFDYANGEGDIFREVKNG